MNNCKKPIITIIASMGIILCTLFSATVISKPNSQEKVIDRVAVIVNNGAILESEIDNMMFNVKQSAIQNRQPLPNDDTLRNQIIERLILDHIIVQQAEKSGIQIPDAEVDSAINNIARQNGLTVSQLKGYIIADGISYADYREQIRKEIMLAEIRNSEVRRRVNILPQEVDKLAAQIAQQQNNAKEYNLSHIIIALPENPTPKQSERAENRVNTILQALKKDNNSFGKLALTYSDDRQTSVNNGQIGWQSLEGLPTFYADAISRSAGTPGTILGPLRSNVGVHIIRINQVRPGKPKKITATEYHSRHILLIPSVIRNDKQTEKELIQLTQEIQSGKISFADAARKYSQDPATAQQGGDLGWSIAEVYDPVFRNTLITMHPNEISTPIKTQFGWHIIELLDTREIDATETAQREQAYQLLFNRKFTEEVQVWMQELRASAYVKYVNNSDK